MLAKQIKTALIFDPERIGYFLENHPELTKKLALELVPRTVGMEIEVENTRDKVALLIRPHSTHSTSELRFFLGKGINFFKELYIVTLLLNEHSTINPSSGIHYHSFTYLKGLRDCFYGISGSSEDSEMNNKFNSEFSKLVNHWGYSGTYNTGISFTSGGSRIMRINESNHTWEIRVGEMTFDYSLIVKRSINSVKITKYIERHTPKLIKSVFSSTKVDILAEKVKQMTPPNSALISIEPSRYKREILRLLGVSQ
jgi:hypothetical protein